MTMPQKSLFTGDTRPIQDTQQKIINCEIIKMDTNNN